TAPVVGIDVCKRWSDVFIHPVGRGMRLSNDAAGIAALKAHCLSADTALVVIEATRRYYREAHRTLHGAGLRIAVVNLQPTQALRGLSFPSLQSARRFA
ncbi:hypothetical protein N9W17_04610, partial [Jannaschia sp.]|nr:hypothetical protein [Jannaschia sp.]